MSVLSQLTTTATEAVETVRAKASDVVIDVRKQLPAVEAKKVQSAVTSTVTSAGKTVTAASKTARKQVIDLVEPATKTVHSLTVRGEKLVRDIAGRPVAKKATRPAAKKTTRPAAKKTTRPVVAKRAPVAKKATTAVAAKKTATKRAVKKAAPAAK